MVTLGYLGMLDFSWNFNEIWNSEISQIITKPWKHHSPKEGLQRKAELTIKKENLKRWKEKEKKKLVKMRILNMLNRPANKYNCDPGPQNLSHVAQLYIFCNRQKIYCMSQNYGFYRFFLIIRILSKDHYHKDKVKSFWEISTVNIYQNLFYLVICITMNFIWKAFKAVFSVFLLFFNFVVHK